MNGRPSVPGWFALVFGLFLGLALLKFGNPVILEQQILPPKNLTEAWLHSWPIRWGNLLMLVLALTGAGLTLGRRSAGTRLSEPQVRGHTGGSESRAPIWPSRWLWILPLAWFGWQLLAATQSVDGRLTTLTLLQFGGCLAAYFTGALLLGDRTAFRLLLVGVLLALAFSLVRAVNQRLIEFPADRQALIEGERTGWTNFPPAMMQQLRADSLVLTTNGVDVANPVILLKLERGRVHGTLVYPNALAGALLLLGPLALTLAITGTARLRLVTRGLVIALTAFLTLAGLFWTGSKSGWLIALTLGGLCLLRLPRLAKWRWAALAAVTVLGLAVFGVRFRDYFAAGATSVGARFDYWRAALTTATANPVFGSGPGTFQRPYARLKAPEAEMARLAHNDYLEQFSDSGVIGGLSYCGWILVLLATVGRRIWTCSDPTTFALFLGVAGWFAQGLSEFALYIPALAWTAFTLTGVLVGLTRAETGPSATPSPTSRSPA